MQSCTDINKNPNHGSILGVAYRSKAKRTDSRGWLTELFRLDELDADFRPKMCYVSETQPQATRGPHEHKEQTDYLIFIGPGDLKLYLWDARPNSPTYGVKTITIVGESNPCAVLIPPGIVHAYKCISSVPALVFNAPNQLYAGAGKSSPPDEIRHENDPNTPYTLDDNTD